MDHGAHGNNFSLLSRRMRKREFICHKNKKKHRKS